MNGSVNNRYHTIRDNRIVAATVDRTPEIKPASRLNQTADQEEEKMFEDIERIIVETEEGEEIATIINDDKIDESIIVADGYTVRVKPKASQPLREKTTYKEAIKMAIEVLEKQMHNCEECKHANYYDWCTLGNHLVLCREHNAMMEDDNCCRDWTPLE